MNMSVYSLLILAAIFTVFTLSNKCEYLFESKNVSLKVRA